MIPNPIAAAIGTAPPTLASSFRVLMYMQPVESMQLRLQPIEKPNFGPRPAVPWDTTVLDGLVDMPESRAGEIMMMIRIAFECLKSGDGEPKDFDRVAHAINIGLIRAESIDPLVEETMLAGEAAMKRCDALWQKHGKFGFYGPDLVLVNDALELYEGILRQSPPVLMEAAVNEAARRMLEQGQAVPA